MSDVKPVPEGMHTITPHLVCKEAGEAIAFYEKAFGAVQGYRMDSPDGSKVLHAELRIGDSVVFLADEFPEWGSLSPASIGGSPVVLSLYVEDADAVFAAAVEAGARVVMPLEDAFWGDRYGKVVDPFGHTWAIATHIRDVSPEEMQQAVQQWAAAQA
ncbi:VOC family protein [Rhodocaloribacter litoris]|uniref:VOC family protein n=1 Tax=Rhodocaloribacter litoris TaxID=2558931 RepID=UPI001421A3A7|nr:VOC family protein [Rhodocaloribacter litoris]QXD16292.1 VOC family protein [Rhodocaloribacter litoris]GIV60888.1 MAG: glyoxalase [Rhodothermaceae bacterium]